MPGSEVRQANVKYVNPAVKGLDPSSPDLTLDQMRAIIEECKANPEYFFAIVCQTNVLVSYSYAHTHYTVSQLYKWDAVHPDILAHASQAKPTFGLSDDLQPDDGCAGSTSPGRSSSRP